MIKIGLTGGIGSGKSTLARHFTESGIPIYNSDMRAKELMSSDKELISKIVAQFGSDSYCETGELNREYLASQIFGDDTKRELMNGIVHPIMRRDFRSWADCQVDAPYVVMESAILFDNGFDKEVDRSVAVLAPEELRIMRVVNRDGAKEEQVKARIAAQLTDDELHNRADFTVVNIFEEDLAGAAQRLDQIFKKLASDELAKQ